MQSSRKWNSRLTEVSTVLIPLILFVIDRAHGVVDYCDEHTFQTNSSYLQFTKEMSDQEYALANKFKSLHCCAKGYRSIEWYKDGVAHPWPRDVSNLILYPESANQTVYTQAVSTVDAGNYTCIVRNDSHVISHSILLFVLEADVNEVGYTGSPLPTYEPKDRYATRGDSTRFFCEAFVGHIDLPDAKSEVRWWRGIPSGVDKNANVDGALKFDNEQEYTNGFPNAVNPSKYHHEHQYHRKYHAKLKPRFLQEIVPREDGQILGAYLFIHEVQNEDFGEYRCAVRNAAGEHTLQMSSWLREEEDKSKQEEEVIFLAPERSMLIPMVLLFLSVILVCLLVILLLKVNILLFWKNRCRRKPDGNGKEYDVCIFYESKKNIATRSITAKDISLSHILPTFESHCGYHCFTHPVPPLEQPSEKDAK